MAEKQRSKKSHPEGQSVAAKATLPHPTEQGSRGTIHQLLCAMGLSHLPSGNPHVWGWAKARHPAGGKGLWGCARAMPVTFPPSLLRLQPPSPRISLLFSSPLTQHPSSRKPGAFSSVRIVLTCWQSCSLQGFLRFLILGVSNFDKAGDREMRSHFPSRAWTTHQIRYILSCSCIQKGEGTGEKSDYRLISV